MENVHYKDVAIHNTKHAKEHMQDFEKKLDPDIIEKREQQYIAINNIKQAKEHVHFVQALGKKLDPRVAEKYLQGNFFAIIKDDTSGKKLFIGRILRRMKVEKLTHSWWAVTTSSPQKQYSLMKWTKAFTQCVKRSAIIDGTSPYKYGDKKTLQMCLKYFLF